VISEDPGRAESEERSPVLECGTFAGSLRLLQEDVGPEEERGDEEAQKRERARRVVPDGVTDADEGRGPEEEGHGEDDDEGHVSAL